MLLVERVSFRSLAASSSYVFSFFLSVICLIMLDFVGQQRSSFVEKLKLPRKVSSSEENISLFRITGVFNLTVFPTVVVTVLLHGWS